MPFTPPSPDTLEQEPEKKFVPPSPDSIEAPAASAEPPTITDQPSSRVGDATDVKGADVAKAWQALNTPTQELVGGPKAAPPQAEVERVAKSGTPLEKRAMGVRQAADEFLGSITSPLGLATFGVAPLIRNAPLAQKAITAAFLAPMAKNLAVDAPKELGTEMGKPTEQRDQTKIARLIGGEVLGLPMAGALGADMVSTAKPQATIPDSVKANVETIKAAAPILPKAAAEAARSVATDLHEKATIKSVPIDSSLIVPPETPKPAPIPTMAEREAQMKAAIAAERERPASGSFRDNLGRMVQWGEHIGYLEDDGAGRPVISKDNKLIELPFNMDAPAEGVTVFRRIQRLNSNPAGQEQPAAKTTEQQSTEQPADEQPVEPEKQSPSYPRPQLADEHVKFLNAVIKTAQAKNPNLQTAYGALEAVPLAKKVLQGHIARLEETGGTPEETEPYYKRLQAIEDFENRYQDVVTTPDKPSSVRARAKTSDILPPLEKAKFTPPPPESIESTNAGGQATEVSPVTPTEQRPASPAPSEPQTVPEKPETLQAQTQMAGQPDNPRAVVFVPKGSEPPADVGNLKRIDANDGTIFFNPEKISESQIADARASGKFHELLGHIESKQEAHASGQPTVITATSPEGTELNSSVVSKERAAEQAAVLQKQNPGATVSETTPEKVIEGRQAEPVQKYRLRNTGPQLWTKVRDLPPQKGDLPDEQFVEVKNDKTGDVQTVEARQLQPVKERTAEEKAAKPKADLDAQLKERGYDPEGLTVADKKALLKRPAKGIISMGGLAPSDPAEPVGKSESETEGYGGDIYGVAERVRSARSGAGQVADVPRGTGTTAPDSVERGRQLLAEGVDAETALTNFERTKRLSSDDMALVRAKGEELAKAARSIESKFGTSSPEYKMAFDALSKWDARSKAMQTEWHKTGMAQQGETDIDTGTFTGLQRAFKDATGKEFTPSQAKKATEIAEKNTKARADAEAAKEKLYSTVDGEKPITPAQAKKELVEHEPGSDFTPEQVKALWKAAKGYIDKGMSDFDDIRHKLAADLGMSVKDVTRGLSQNQSTRRLANDVWAKQAAARRLKQSALQWIEQQRSSSVWKAAKLIPRFMFSAKVFGHGTVGMITHAGNMMFNPTAMRPYWVNFFRQYKLIGLHDGGAYHEMKMQDLVRDPNYITARRAGLANDPFRSHDDYQNPDAVNFFKKVGLMGNRGFDALKLLRQERFNQAWDSLPESLQTPEMAKLIADAKNHETGTITSSLGQVGKAANMAMFAPKLEGSRWAFLIGDPVKSAKTFTEWKTATPEEKAAAIQEIKQKAYIVGMYASALVANQVLLSASGSNQKINFTDPRRGDFLSFKVAGHDIGIIKPLTGMVRLFANLMHDAYGRRSNIEKAAGSRFGEFGGDAAQYARGKLSPFAVPVVDSTFQADYEGRPMPWSRDKVPPYLRRQGIHERYSYGEYAAQTFLPIPAQEAITDVWRHQGMSKDQQKVWMEALVKAAAMGLTGVRVTESKPEKK